MSKSAEEKFREVQSIYNEMVGESSKPQNKKILNESGSLPEEVKKKFENEDGWPDEFLSYFELDETFNNIESLIYEMRSARRGVYYKGFKEGSIDELVQALRGFSERFNEISDHIEDHQDELNS